MPTSGAGKKVPENKACVRLNQQCYDPAWDYNCWVRRFHHPLPASYRYLRASYPRIPRRPISALISTLLSQKSKKSPYQFATDLLKLSVIILVVVVRTAVGSLLMVAMLRLAAKSSKFWKICSKLCLSSFVLVKRILN